MMTMLGLALVIPLARIALPLGISFFTFKHIGYLLDIAKKRYEPTSDFLLFSTYSAFFPQISAGPISNFSDTGKQLANLPEKMNRQQIFEGIAYLSMGLAKKALIADSLGRFLMESQAAPGAIIGFFPAWYVVASYAMQLYFDFSGYTDIALGIARLFGVNLPENFNNPYLASGPSQFWERWHISLSVWFRQYLFSPLSRTLLQKWGSNRKDEAQYVSNLVTMALVGLWHGASFTFILWGIYHALLINIYSGWKRYEFGLYALARRGLFLLALAYSWAVFMSPDFNYLGTLTANLFGFGGLGTVTLFTAGNTPILLIALLLAFSGRAEARNMSALSPKNNLTPLLWGTLAALSLLFLANESQFLYVQF
jgi:alginate O-acetyltransferase complex protein AlgI